MPATMRTTLSNESCDAAILVDGTAVPVRVRRSTRARHYRLTLDSRAGGLRLSVPARASLKGALRWAQGHEAWVREQLARTPEVLPFAPGVRFPLEGQEVEIAWDSSGPRRVVRDGPLLRVGGPAERVGARVLRWLRARAKEVLEAETVALAERHSLPLTSVAIGDPRSRWGSCTTSGAIRYSWRLILCPPEVRRATVAHEAAHLVHMNHSPAFHREHARLLGSDPKPARAWLRTHGAGLHRIGS